MIALQLHRKSVAIATLGGNIHSSFTFMGPHENFAGQTKPFEVE